MARMITCKFSFWEKNDPLHFIEIIGQMFPQVETLVFSFDTMSVRIYYTALPQLITRWPNLESLTLSGAIRTTPDFSWLPLLKALNSLKSLKRFEMFIDCVDEYLETVDFSPMDMQCYSTEASFIQQLEYFLSISSLLNIVDNVLPLFSPNCKRLHPWDITSISSLTTVTPTLTHLALGDLIIKDDELIPLIEIISSRFTKLQFLDLCLNGEEISSTFLRHLRQLKHLTELRLSDGIFNLNDHCSQIALPTVERIQLNTMGILSSDAPTQHTFSMYCLCVLNVRPQICDRLAAIFPNVAEIELDYQFPELVALLENKEKFPHLRKVQTTDDIFKEYGMQSGEDAKNK